jgi:hypothetical protein
VTGGGEAIHVDPDLRQDDLGAAASHPRDGAQPADLLSERGHEPLDLLVQLLDPGSQMVDVLEVHAQQEVVVLSEAPLEREPQVGNLGPHPATCVVGQHRRVLLSGEQPVEHVAGRLTEDVGHHGVQLDPRVLQELLDALGLLGAVGDQFLAIPGEVAEVGDRGRRHEASPQQPALGELGQPGRVRHVRLAAGNALDVVRVDELQLEGGHLLEHVPDGAPVDAGRLHHHHAHLLADQPVAELPQVAGVAPELPDRLLSAALGSRHADRSHDGVLVDVEPRDPIHHHVHRPLLRETAPGASCVLRI